ncbi:MAG TPA: transcriptional regulator [Elusimicrobia bacterium]|nr:transcriptional regulator [Elusimicrobiota bacterium]
MIKELKAAPMFSLLREDSARRLVERCVPRRLKTGEVLFSAGEKADRFFVVLSGRVKLYKISPKGDEQILHLYGAGNTFGEAAAWGGLPYPAFAEAVEDSAILPVSRDALRKAVASDPDLVLGMLAGMSAKLREFAGLIEELSLKEVPARLAGALLAESERRGSRSFELKQSKRALAAQIGTIPETLSRALSKLSARKLIAVEGSAITLRDPAGLRRAAEGLT